MRSDITLSYTTIVSGLNSRSFRQTVSQFVETSQNVTALQPIAVTANTICHLRCPDNVQQTNLLNLFHALPVQEVFKTLSPGALFVYADKPPTFSLQEELSKIVAGIHFWDDMLARICVDLIIASWGLPDLYLSFEYQKQNRDDAQYQSATNKLREIEDGFDLLYSKLGHIKSDNLYEILRVFHEKELQREFKPHLNELRAHPPSEKLLRLSFLLKAYIAALPSPETRSLTNFLTGHSEGNGPCTPTHILGAHLAMRQGFMTQLVEITVPTIGHVCLFEPESELIIDVLNDFLFASPSSWKQRGLLATNSEPLPLRLLIAKLLGHSDDIETGLKLLPEAYSIQRLKAIVGSGAEERIPLFLQLLESNPNDIDVHVRLGASYSLAKQLDQAAVHFRTALDLMKNFQDQKDGWEIDPIYAVAIDYLYATCIELMEKRNQD